MSSWPLCRHSSTDAEWHLARTKAADDSSDAARADIDTAAESLADGASTGLDEDNEPDSEEARDVDGPTSPGPDLGSGSSSGPHAVQYRSQQQAKSKQLQVAKLSKFEAERLEQAKQRHRTQIAQPKVGEGSRVARSNQHKQY